MLSTVKLYFQWLAETKDLEKRENIAKTGIQNIDDAIQAVREISNKLSPRVLINMGLLSALKYLVYQLNETKKIKIFFTTDIETRYDSQTEITLYRIFSELINNTLKYANAREIKIVISNDFDRKKLLATYDDDGIGFNIEDVMQSKKGMGLYNMKHRIETLNGFINFDTDNGKPLRVDIELPLTEMR
jgi:signal transduction histidine kinase